MVGTTMYADNDGVRIAWEVHGPLEPVEEPPTLVLVHGLGYARAGWGVLPDLLARHVRVVMLDNRGIGASDVPPGPYAAAEMAGDVVAVLDAAGLRRAHVLGASLGGMVAQEIALAHPDRVQRLVFGEVAEEYDRHRPTYPDELFTLLIDRADPDEVLDIEFRLQAEPTEEH